MVHAVALSMASIAAWVAGTNAYTLVQNVEHTFYGWPDNNPPGASIAYDCGRGYIAGGDGSYNDPLTFASAPGEFNQCEIIWDPYTEKYLRFEDECTECENDWNNGQYHIDIWTGSNQYGGGSAQIQCEDDLTPNSNHDVVRFGYTGHQANTGPLFANGQCYTNNVYPNNN